MHRSAMPLMSIWLSRFKPEDGLPVRAYPVRQRTRSKKKPADRRVWVLKIQSGLRRPDH